MEREDNQVKKFQQFWIMLIPVVGFSLLVAAIKLEELSVFIHSIACFLIFIFILSESE